ncbi:unnamed protein product [Didymodactylos carnosus]|uniref:Sugar transporter SWEET1 n=1 Tax=Didymodactylos carnosus TaxID=1234261 RepID=A0A814L9Q6_9BILA|nr:unnamed protein product [Didymodactylos carnosus]CAF1062893.1 unnamed protein product [Didymodactylos carnosus]CAF3726475.1 unnamed protein product [Didymodactylos carnosus]CAF3830956.1 unnamed protein product [Didymodactylos carnosus]
MTDSSTSLTPLFENICTICTIALFLTGTQICKRIYRMNATGDISGFPFIATFVNCTLWVLYGYSSDNSAILLVNLIGAFLQMFYALFYLRYAQDRYNSTDKLSVVFRTGIICCVCTVIMFGSPLASLKEVVQKQSTDSLSFPLCFANFVVATEWFLYGLLIDDRFVQVPNFLGAILGIIQVSLFLKYSKQSPLLPKVTNLGGI